MLAVVLLLLLTLFLVNMTLTRILTRTSHYLTLCSHVSIYCLSSQMTSKIREIDMCQNTSFVCTDIASQELKKALLCVSKVGSPWGSPLQIKLSPRGQPKSTKSMMQCYILVSLSHLVGAQTRSPKFLASHS